MLQNNQDLTNNVGDEGTDFQRAYIEGRLGGVQVTAGRHDFQLGDANLYDTRMDGIKIAYGDKVKFGAYYGKPTMNGGAQDFVNRRIQRYSLAGYVTVAKNMVAGLEWYDLKGKENSDNKEKTLWSELVVSF